MEMYKQQIKKLKEEEKQLKKQLKEFKKYMDNIESNKQYKKYYTIIQNLEFKRTIEELIFWLDETETEKQIIELKIMQQFICMIEPKYVDLFEKTIKFIETEN